jgi:outer membrane protein assembly factor BamB
MGMLILGIQPIVYAGFSSVIARDVNNGLKPFAISAVNLPTIDWSFDTSEAVVVSAVARDVTDDTGTEVLVGSIDRNFYCIASNGNLLWNYTTNTSIPQEGVSTMATIVDVDGDSSDEVLFGAFDGNVYCLEASSGAFRWAFQANGTTGTTGSAPAVATSALGSKVVIVGVEKGLLCLNASDGGLMWKVSHEAVGSSPAIIDCDHDGQQEVVYGTNENIVRCVNLETGMEEWATALPGSGSVIWADPLPLDNGQSTQIFVVTFGGGIYELDGSSGVPQTIGYIEYGWADAALCDLDRDGVMELIVVGYEGNVKVFDTQSGSLLWHRDLNQYINNGPCIVDIDRDGSLEVILVTTSNTNGRLVCLSSSGVLKWQVHVDRVDILSPFAIDIDLDGYVEIVFGTENGVVCYEVAVAGNYAYLWPWIGERGGAGATGNWADSDNDSLIDCYECFVGIDAFSEDTDGDGLKDALEFAHLTNPLLNDTDQDGIPDSWQVEYAFKPLNPDDALRDADLDDLSNLEEYNYGTNPRDSDSDNDTLSDIDELMIYGTSPMNNDTDSDQLSDADEILVYGTDPLSNDTDEDGFSDLKEIQNGCNPLVQDWPCHWRIELTTAVLVVAAGVLLLLFIRRRRAQQV